jgi:hypothetical protein
MHDTRANMFNRHVDGLTTTAKRCVLTIWLVFAPRIMAVRCRFPEQQFQPAGV